MPCEYCTRSIKRHIILERWQGQICDARASLEDIMTRNLRTDGASVERRIKVDLFLDGSRKASLARILRKETQNPYILVFSFVQISLMCRNRLGCLDYKYIPPSIVKGLSHDQYKIIYFLKYFYLSALGVGVIQIFDEFFSKLGYIASISSSPRSSSTTSSRL